MRTLQPLLAVAVFASISQTFGQEEDDTKNDSGKSNDSSIQALPGVAPPTSSPQSAGDGADTTVIFVAIGIAIVCVAVGVIIALKLSQRGQSEPDEFDEENDGYSPRKGSLVGSVKAPEDEDDEEENMEKEGGDEYCEVDLDNELPFQDQDFAHIEGAHKMPGRRFSLV